MPSPETEGESIPPISANQGPAAPSAASPGVPAIGKRPAFQDMRRQLTPEELASPGVQKILYDDLEQCEADREELKVYVKAYYDADKRAAVLLEKMKTVNTIEVFFGVGVGLGGSVLGLAPFFWEMGTGYGVAALIIGLSMTIGACVGRLIKL